MFETQTRRWLSTTALTVTAFCLGLNIGRPSANDVPALPSHTPELRTPDSRCEQNQEQAPSMTTGHEHEFGSVADGTEDGDTNDSMDHGPSQQTAIPDLSPQSLSDRLARLRTALSKAHANEAQDLTNELSDLTTMATTSPEVRAAILQQFLSAAGTEEGSTLAGILSVANDPAVEDALLNLVQTGSTPEQRVAGLEALSQSMAPSPSTRHALTELLQNHAQDDERFLVAGLAALSRRSVTTRSEQEQIVHAIQPLAQSSNTQVREQALRVMAEWAPHDPNVLTTLIAAARDPEASVRSSVVQALGQAGTGSDEVRDIILNRMRDPAEDPQVRMTASQALEAFPLDDDSYQAYAEFKQSAPSENEATVN